MFVLNTKFLVSSQVVQVLPVLHVRQVDMQATQEEVLKYFPEGQRHRPETIVIEASRQVRHKVESVQVPQPFGQAAHDDVVSL